MFTAQYSIVDLIWANEKAVCVPAAYFDEALAVSMLETMHAVSPPVQFSVNKAEDIVVVGYIPADAFKVYAANFEVRSNEHKYFQLIRGLSHGDHKHAAYVLFDHSDFTYVVRKDGQLQLIQTRAYKTSEDVLYHLLNSFRVFAIPTQEINIVASGMIDDSSPLYKTFGLISNILLFRKWRRQSLQLKVLMNIHYIISLHFVNKPYENCFRQVWRKKNTATGKNALYKAYHRHRERRVVQYPAKQDRLGRHQNARSVWRHR